MDYDVVRVTTFTDDIIDVPKVNVKHIINLKEVLCEHLECRVENIRLLHAGKELNDSDNVLFYNRLYACVVPIKCICHNKE